MQSRGPERPLPTVFVADRLLVPNEDSAGAAGSAGCTMRSPTSTGPRARRRGPRPTAHRRSARPPDQAPATRRVHHDPRTRGRCSSRGAGPQLGWRLRSGVETRPRAVRAPVRVRPVPRSNPFHVSNPFHWSNPTGGSPSAPVSTYAIPGSGGRQPVAYVGPPQPARNAKVHGPSVARSSTPGVASTRGSTAS